MKSIIASASIAALLASGAAFAQTNPSTAPAAPAPAAKPAEVAKPAPAPAAAPAVKKAEGWLGTQVWKQGVYDAQNTRIGEVDDLVITTSGQITHALIGVGGFLGIGEKTVSVPFSALKPMAKDGRIWFELNQTKEQLTAAPAFDPAPYKR